ncbi:MAG: substrate-binding domain-containing protein [Mesorhizobium sp.]
MGERRLNGVDAALDLLQALNAAGGDAANQTLMQATGLSRSSLHRIARVLASRGVVTLERGRIRVGPIAASLFAADRERLQLEQQKRAPRAAIAGIRALVTPSDDDGPLPLSRPLQPRRQPKRFRVGFSNIALDSPWRVALVHSVEHAASTLRDGIVRLSVRHAGIDADRQAQDIAAFVDEGVDGLIVSGISAPQVRDAIDDAMARGVEVVMVDRRVADANLTSFVTGSDEAIGRNTARWLVDTLGGRGTILMLPGDGEVEPAQVRFAAAKAVFDAADGIEILGIHWTDWLREGGFASSTGAIARYGRDIGGVWCCSGLQGVGSMEAFVAAGRKPGEIPPHTGGDLNLAYKLAIRHNIKLAAMDYPPAMGFRAVEVLLAALNGRHVPRRIDVATDLVMTRSAAMPGVRPHAWAEDHVRWDLPDDLILASGLGPAYNPKIFRVHYPGNSYNRSAAAPARRSA